MNMTGDDNAMVPHPPEYGMCVKKLRTPNLQQHSGALAFHLFCMVHTLI